MTNKCLVWLIKDSKSGQHTEASGEMREKNPQTKNPKTEKRKKGDRKRERKGKGITAFVYFYFMCIIRWSDGRGVGVI
jgi:hypothetical protein